MRHFWAALLVIMSVCPVVAKTDSLLLIVQKMPADDTNLPGIYTQIAWSYLADNDTTHTLLYLQKSKQSALKQNASKKTMTALSNIGLYYTRFGIIDSAVSYFSQCLKKAKNDKEANVAAKTCANLAGAYLSMGNYAEAIQYYLEAMQYLEQTNDQQKIAANYHCLGIAYYMLKNFRLSLLYYFKSLETGNSMNKPDESGYNYNGIGVVYKELKQYDSALYYLNRAHADAEKNKDYYLLSHNLSNTGEVYSLLNRLPEALDCLSRAMVIQVQNKDQRGIAETSVLLGNTYAGNKNYAKAKKYFDSACHIANAIDAKDVLKNAWQGLSAVYKSMHNYPAAMEAYQNYADLKDTLYTEESSRQIAEMQTRYNTEKKEKENILLQKENALELLQITHERNQKYWLVIAFAIIGISSVVYYNQYRLKQKNELLKERELRAYAVFQAQEHEKHRLSKELHDGVGALLSLIKLNISGIQADDANAQLLSRTKNLASDALKEVREIAHDLMPSVLAKSGLQEALAELAESVNGSGSMEMQFSCTLSKRLPAAIESNIYRIVQEATNNIIKHAAATRETIDIVATSDQLMVNITDNGMGFDKQILTRISGNGLNNIYSRVNAMKGTTDITTSKGNGTQIAITVPLNNTNHA